MAATSVTLGATILLCRENDTQVQVPLFRRGRDSELTEVEVTTEDGSAKLGEHYLPIVTTNGGKLEEVGRPVTTVSFEPGAQNNLQMVAVPLRHSRAYDATVSIGSRPKPHTSHAISIYTGTTRPSRLHCGCASSTRTAPPATAAGRCRWARSSPRGCASSTSTPSRVGT